MDWATDYIPEACDRDDLDPDLFDDSVDTWARNSFGEWVYIRA